MGGVFFEWFGVVEWSGGGKEEMMEIIFGLGALELGVRKTNWERRAKGRVGGDVGGAGRVGNLRAREISNFKK